ncbi:hypothetical protein BJY52DRAFT_909097 [Lactarius psammicola]|nr:hypothetical protein BJY52DRAFT_909097 [Lactarius psammicola]
MNETDKDDWARFTDYCGFKTDRVIEWFWACLHSWLAERTLRLLQLRSRATWQWLQGPPEAVMARAAPQSRSDTRWQDRRIGCSARTTSESTNHPKPHTYSHTESRMSDKDKTHRKDDKGSARSWT